MVGILIGMAFPWAGQLLSSIPFDPFPGLSYPPVCFAITGLFMIVAISEARLFDAIPVSRALLGLGAPAVGPDWAVRRSGETLPFPIPPEGEATERALPREPSRTLELRAYLLGSAADGLRMVI